MGTNAIPVEIDSIRDLIDFKPPKRQFYLLNGAKKDKDLMYTGTMLTIPDVRKVGLHPVLDADGDAIPGTLTVEDMYSWDDHVGDDWLNFDAAKAVRYWLGIVAVKNGQAAQATSRFALGGITLLNPRPTKEMWQHVAKTGAERAFLVDVENARYAIMAIEEKNSKLVAAGMAAVHGGLEYQRAQAIIAQHAKLFLNDAALDIMAPHEEADEDELVLMAAFVEAEAMKLAKAVATDDLTDKVELTHRLLANPAIRKRLEKTFRIRKRGQLPGKDLAAQAAAMNLAQQEPEPEEDDEE